MKRLALALAAVSSFTLVDGVARATPPTTADCLAATESSVKLGNEHKLRAERTRLLVCAATSCPADIRKDCVGRVEAVSAQIPTIIFAASDASGSDLSAVNVTMDGEALTERLDGTALSIDPGEHTFRFASAAPLVPAPESPSVVPSPPLVELPPAPPPVLAMDTASGTSTWNTRKTLALVVGGAGIAGVAIGGIFGGVAASKWSGAKGESCPNCTQAQFQQATSDQSSATSAATGSTVAFIAGGALVAVGAVLWFTAPSGHVTPPSATALRVIPEIGPGSGGLVVQGGF
jgi:hypothetical protein